MMRSLLIAPLLMGLSIMLVAQPSCPITMEGKLLDRLPHVKPVSQREGQDFGSLTPTLTQDALTGAIANGRASAMTIYPGPSGLSFIVNGSFYAGGKKFTISNQTVVLTDTTHTYYVVGDA